jgi:hypothetical protein
MEGLARFDAGPLSVEMTNRAQPSDRRSPRRSYESMTRCALVLEPSVAQKGPPVLAPGNNFFQHPTPMRLLSLVWATD